MLLPVVRPSATSLSPRRPGAGSTSSFPPAARLCKREPGCVRWRQALGGPQSSGGAAQRGSASSAAAGAQLWCEPEAPPAAAEDDEDDYLRQFPAEPPAGRLVSDDSDAQWVLDVVWDSLLWRECHFKSAPCHAPCRAPPRAVRPHRSSSAVIGRNNHHQTTAKPIASRLASPK